MSPAAQRWALACRAAAALATAPALLGGAVVRARAGPVRDAWMDLVAAMAPVALTKVPPDIADDRLLGGLDLSATLRAGRPVLEKGLLQTAAGGLLVLPMAERVSAGLAGRIAVALDDQTLGVIALDEAAEPEETPPPGLTDRLAIDINLHGLSIRDCDAPGTPDIALAIARLPTIESHPDQAEALTRTAAAMAINSMRAPMLALRTARVLAALDGAAQVGDDHVSAAAALVLLPRALVLPQTEQEDPAQDQSPPPPDDPSDPKPEQQQGEQLEDRVLEAIAAHLPLDLLHLAAGRDRRRSPSGGSGAKQMSTTRGRPAGTRRHKPDGRNRLDLLATLRAAAPWQALRRRDRPDRAGLIILADDFRTKRFLRPAESCLIFAVDASGSAAAARLAEAKGAVELLLSEAYQRREKIALIAFRGTEADLLLPPTRALLQAKRKLSVLPGGGGTPLAKGLLSAHHLACQVRQRGGTPFVFVLTDGRGNIGLDGKPGRAQAKTDAEAAARTLFADGISTVLIDTANRPQAAARDLAAQMDARYVPMPRADAQGLSRTIRNATT